MPVPKARLTIATTRSTSQTSVKNCSYNGLSDSRTLNQRQKHVTSAKNSPATARKQCDSAVTVKTPIPSDAGRLSVENKPVEQRSDGSHGYCVSQAHVDHILQDLRMVEKVTQKLIAEVDDLKCDLRGIPPNAPIVSRHPMRIISSTPKVSPSGVSLHLAPKTPQPRIKVSPEERRWIPLCPKPLNPPHTGDDPALTYITRNCTLLLNKLTWDNFIIVSYQIFDLGITTPVLLEKVIRLIFNATCRQAMYGEMYARLCYRMMYELTELAVEDKNSQSLPTQRIKMFRQALLDNCKMEFERILMMTPVIQMSDAACTDVERRALMERTFGNCQFIGQIYKWGILSVKVIRKIMEVLLKIGGSFSTAIPLPEAVEAACLVFISVGPRLEEDEKNDQTFSAAQGLLENVLRRLEYLSTVKSYGPRITGLICDVIAASRNNWVFRVHRVFPETLASLRHRAFEEMFNFHSLLPHGRHRHLYHQLQKIFIPLPSNHIWDVEGFQPLQVMGGNLGEFLVPNACVELTGAEWFTLLCFRRLTASRQDSDIALKRLDRFCAMFVVNGDDLHSCVTDAVILANAYNDEAGTSNVVQVLGQIVGLGRKMLE